MKADLDERLRSEGRRLREDRFPVEIAPWLRRPPEKWRRATAFVVVSLVLFLALLALLPRAGDGEEPRITLVTPPEGSPLAPALGPLTAVFDPPFRGGSVRVYLDETEFTSFAETGERYVILEPPEPMETGPHLLRFEILDRNGRIVGEPSWLIYAL